jgi:ferric-dicitrate binding protein FerR (iron transport regulator)
VKNRTVRLEGEAFFEVSKSEEIPFIVESGLVTVEVHGTSFNVKAYKKDKTASVALLKGSVSLLSPSTNKRLTYLKPDEMAIIHAQDLRYEVLACDAGNESIWHLNKLHFENAPAGEVWEKLERWYGVNIKIENMKPDLTYRFTIKTETLTELLALIHKLTPVEYKLNGEEVSVRYK